MTWQPWSASNCVKHLPMPLLAPVTTATESLAVHGMCSYLSRFSKRIYATSVELSLTGLSVIGSVSDDSAGWFTESGLGTLGVTVSEAVVD